MILLLSVIVHILPFLQQALLRFSPQEQAFYDNILERTRLARNRWEQQLHATSAALAAPSNSYPAAEADHRGKETLLVESMDLTSCAKEEAATADEGVPPSTLQCTDLAIVESTVSPTNRNIMGKSRSGGRSRRPAREAVKKERGGLELALTARNSLLQLRIACIHPQLTAYWRELSAELQLRVRKW
jgi:hypothetical protein